MSIRQRAREKREVKIFGRLDPYVIGRYVPEMLEKYSPWLRGLRLEFSGPSDVMNILMKSEHKKNSIVLSGSSYWAMAYNAIPPYKESYTHYAIAQQHTVSIGLITLNPSIRSCSDLRGKRVNMYLSGSIVNEVFSTVLKFHGIYDEVDKVYVGYPEGRDGLLDGSIDATENAFHKGPGVIAPNTTMLDLISKRPGDLHLITFTEEEVAEIGRKAFFPVVVMEIKAEEIVKKYGLKEQKEDISWVTVFHWWGCDKELDAEVTYEICRVMNEHMREYAIQHHARAQGWTAERLAKEVVYPLGGLTNCGVKREFFHPGALKYYDEVGIKVVEPPLPGEVTWLKER